MFKKFTKLPSLFIRLYESLLIKNLYKSKIKLFDLKECLVLYEFDNDFLNKFKFIELFENQTFIFSINYKSYEINIF